MSIYQKVEKTGYCSTPLTWKDGELRWGKFCILMNEAGLDQAPPGVDEVLILEPRKAADKHLDAALITIPAGSATPVQRLRGKRKFVEQPTEGEGMWVGIAPDSSSYIYDPATTYSIKTKKNEGSLVYGPGWTQCWVNLGNKPLKYAELCLPKFQNDGSIDILKEDEPVESQMFWGLWRLLTSQR